MRRHTVFWMLLVVVAFILGYLLGQHPPYRAVPPNCPQPGQQRNHAGAMKGGGARGAGAPQAGSPVKLGANGGGNGTVGGSAGVMAGGGAGTPPGGDGSGDGDLQAGGLDDAGGNAVSSGKNGVAGSGSGDGDMDMDGGNGHATAAEPPPRMPSTAPLAAPPLGTDHPKPETGGKLGLGPPIPDAPNQQGVPESKVVAALDYRYDKSGLPHYPNAVKVASGTDAAAAAEAAGPASKNFSVTEILTDDTPDAVASWYHAYLPAGWNELSMPSTIAMDQAMQQVKPSPTDTPVDGMLKMIAGSQLAQSRPGIDAARAAGMTIFEPADPNVDHRMIIVIKDGKTGKTGVLLMKKADPS